ncbi:autotransporter outer membrane beta-barrel domain-containing protein [Marinibactrum halimedae]|uniref:Autotransporter domain-containing protein n=1 Tax=Marinibactrum halimedae TaxID=1444977 RepID=A0AA37T3C9_9GAMM|nr:autotransporter outer membrane beta-barrel domain-containing protein [Marinibactrum halimedae]MCD9459134.1 autotransporter outer membrane beta-barrel domain-containing protein [Marinibactrum halimedae]GLS24736.1 hypothetical protein GCM10007877_04500 [Marinibactrum halimedae]
MKRKMSLLKKPFTLSTIVTSSLLFGVNHVHAFQSFFVSTDNTTGLNQVHTPGESGEVETLVIDAQSNDTFSLFITPPPVLTESDVARQDGELILPGSGECTITGQIISGDLVDEFSTTFSYTIRDSDAFAIDTQIISTSGPTYSAQGIGEFYETTEDLLLVMSTNLPRLDFDCPFSYEGNPNLPISIIGLESTVPESEPEPEPEPQPEPEPEPEPEPQPEPESEPEPETPVWNKIADTPGLNTRQFAVASAFDGGCPILLEGIETSETTVSQQEESFFNTCMALQASETLGNDLNQIAPTNLLSLADLSLNNSKASSRTLTRQVQSQRNNFGGFNMNGLALNIDGQHLPIGKLGSGASADSIASDWGTFVTGTLKVGQRESDNGDLDFDLGIDALLFGIDYRLTDSLIVGAALGYSNGGTDSNINQSEIDLESTNVSLFGSYYYGDQFYIDGIVTQGQNDYETRRQINLFDVQDIANSEFSGDDFNVAFNIGYNINIQQYRVRLFNEMNYIEVDTDAFIESVAEGSELSGIMTRMDSNTYESLVNRLGVELAMAINMDFGVITPSISLDWEKEFKDDDLSIRGLFVGDPSQTAFELSSERAEQNFANARFGLNAIFKGGFSAYAVIDTDLNRDNASNQAYSLGVRWEL